MKLFDPYFSLRCRSFAIKAKRVLLCLSLWILMGEANLFAQGPGGLTATDGLTVWLRADLGFLGTTWTNQVVGPLYNGSCTSITSAPTAFNFNPGLDVNANNDQIDITPLPPVDDFEFFIVFKTGYFGGFNPAPTFHWRDEGNLVSAENDMTVQDFGMTIATGKVVWQHDGNNSPLIVTNNAINDNVARISSVSRRSTGQSQMWLNGRTEGTGTATTTGPLNGQASTNDKIELFGAADNPGQGDLTGQVAEYIMFANNISPADRARVHSYLAIKYGITMDTTYLNSLGQVIYNPGGYSTEIIGVANDPGSDLLQKQSVPANIANALTLYVNGGYNGTYPTSNLSNLTANPSSYSSLVIGRDGGGVQFNDPFLGLPSTRMTRIFKVTDRNSMGTVTLNFNNATYIGFQTGQQYTMVVSANTAFGDAGDVYVPMTENGTSGSYRAEYDFPNNTTVFVSIIRGSSFGPGGVGTGLAAWFRGDSAVTNHTNVSTWRDCSGFNKHATNTQSAFTSVTRGGVNFNHFLNLPVLNRQFATGTGVVSQTLFMVSKLDGAGSVNEGIMGFNGDRGVFLEAGPALSNDGDIDEFQTGAPSFLRQNGNVITAGTNPPFNNSWGVSSFLRNATHPLNTFYIGGFRTGRPSPAGLKVGEIIIYSENVGSSAPALSKIESYLAMKYGVSLTPTSSYYASNWDGTSGTIVYTPTGYGAHVTVIGRDERSRLNQRQSKNTGIGATITLGLNAEIRDSNAANTKVFNNDLTFVAVGDNGGGDCWTNVELNMVTNARQWLRVGREWKITKTGIVDSVAVRITNASTGFRIPNLPAGATEYVLLMSTNFNFDAAPIPTVIPLVDNGTYLQATLTNALMSTGGGTNYFTLGVKLPAAEYQTQVPCVGDTIELIGVNILNGAGLCLELQRPGDTITLTQNTSISPTNFVALASNSTVGCLDTALWVVPPTVVADYYLATSAACNGTYYNGMINDSIRLGQPLTPDITVGLSDTVYLCLGDQNVNLDRTSNPGGGIMGITNYPGASPSSISALLDSASLQLAAVGSIYVHSGNLGHHLVTYRYPSGCSSTDSVHIYIGANTASTYSYANSTLCITDTSLKAATTLPNYATTGGSFSSIPAGLNLNATTGQINASISGQGAYLATFTPQDSTCGLPVTIPITVNNPQQTVFGYPLNPCAGTPLISPTITSYAPGGTFSINPTTGATIHPTTGQLTLTNSAAGPYHITYTLPGSCVVNYVDSIFVLIKPTVVFPPLGVAGEVCKMTPFVDASAIPTGGNYFSSTASPNLVINGNRIWVDSSMVGGPYVISYIYADVNGCLDTASQLLTILPLDSPVVSFPRGGYCTNEPPQTPFFFPPTSTAGTFSSSPAGLTLATNGTLTPSTSQGGIYTINFAYQHPACPTPVPVDIVEIAPAVQAGFTLDSAACFGSGSITLTPNPGALLGSLELFYAGNPYPTSSQHVQGSNTILFVGTGGDSLAGDLSYSIVNTATNSLGCTEQSSGHFLLVADQNSAFDYLEPLYCANTSDPTPFIYGIGGGLFSSPTLTPQTQLDTATGLLHLLASFTGNNASDTFRIAYTTPGPCPSTSWDTVYVREGYDSYFQFPLSIVCSSIGTVVPTDVAEDSVGVSGFTQIAGPTLNLNAQTGVISNLQSLGVGPGQTTSITVAHWTGSANNCQDTTTQELEISMFDGLFGIEYNPNIVCGNQLVPPTLSGDVSTAYVNNPIGVTYAVGSLGIVDARFSLADTHNIVMTDGDVCGERDTAVLIILGLPDASFVYDAPGICTTDSFFTPDSIKTLGGSFGYEGVDSFFVLNLDTTSGVITIQGSDPGLYTVYHSVVSSNGCPNTDSVYVTLSRSPVLRLLEAQPGPSVCVNQLVTFSSSGDGTVSWYLDNVFTGRTGPIYTNASLTNGQVVKAVLRNTSGCTDSLAIQMEVLPPPTVTVVDRPAVITENEPFSIQLQPGQDNTIIAWEALATGLAIEDTLDTTVVVNANDIHSITNVLKLFSDYDPGTIQYWFTPMNNGCIGTVDSILIIVNPNGDRVFIPEVMTPNGDEENQVWEIRYDSDLSATDYTIEVYNRSGGLVYTLRDLDEKWDGGSNPDGVYWWILRHKSGEAELAGGLTIRRE